MITESDYAYYADILEDRLSLCQYRANKRRFFRSIKKQRPYKVYVEQEVPKFGIEPQINAFSLYDKNIDRIFVMRELINFLAYILGGVSDTKSQYTWMFHAVLYFCSFHEFGHLYLGHCQLKPDCRLAMTFTDNFCDELSPKDLQAMEFEADMYAAGELADLVREQIHSKKYKQLWGYNDIQQFYSDSLKAICCFFSMIKWNEYHEQEKRFLGYKEPYDHPSFLLREYLVGSLFQTWMDKHGFGRRDSELRYFILNTDTLFMRMPHDSKQIEYEYSAILDGSIKQHIAHVIDYCNEILDKKTAPFTRLNVSGSMPIKLRT